MSKKRQWSIEIHRQFFDFPSRLAKVEEEGLYQIYYAMASGEMIQLAKGLNLDSDKYVTDIRR